MNRPQALWLAIGLVAVALSGCAGDDAPEEHDHSTHDHADDAGTMAPESEATPNAAPEVVLTADVTNVTIPANVTFGFAFLDADGDDLEWRFDLDGDGEPETQATAVSLNGSYEPTNFTVSLDREGTYNATLTVHDGESEANATLAIVASVAEVTEDGLVTSQEASGSWLVGATMVGCFGDIFGVGYPGNLEGIAYSSFAIEPGTIGRPYTVEVTTPYEQDSPGFTFLGEDGSIVLGGFMSDMAAGTVPSGAVTGVFWTCLGADMSGAYQAG